MRVMVAAALDGGRDESRIGKTDLLVVCVFVVAVLCCAVCMLCVCCVCACVVPGRLCS